MASQPTLMSLWGQPPAEGESNPKPARENKRPAVDSEAPTPAKRQATAEDCVDLTAEPEKRQEQAPSAPQKGASTLPMSPPLKPLKLNQAPSAPSGAKVGKTAATAKAGKAAAPAKAKKAPAAVGGAKGPKEAYKKVTQHGVKDAEYFDQCIGWAKLSDGREVVLGAEVWHVPAGFAAHPGKETPVQVGKLPERAGVWGRFAALDGLDLLAVTESRSDKAAVTLHELPACGEVARLELPEGCGQVKHIVTAGKLVLVANDKRLCLITASPASDGATASLALTLDVDLAAAGPLTRALGQAETGCYGSGLVRSLGLFVDPHGSPHAVLGSATNGQALIVPLSGASPGDMRVGRAVEMHAPMKKSDKRAWVGGMAVWQRAEGGASLVTVGSDGMCAVAELHDGKELAEGSWADDSWHCTTRGSGGSKGYPYAPAFTVAVHSESGVAFTGGQSEPVGHLWDLESAKSSPEGRRLCKTPKFASGRPSRVLLMTAGFSPSGLLALSNSNSDEDDTLKIVRPAGRGK